MKRSRDLNQQFKALEDQYLYSRSDTDLFNMFNFIKLHLTKNIKLYARKKKIFFPDLEENVDIGTNWFICRYIKDPAFKCQKFTTYINFARLKATCDYAQVKEDKIKKKFVEVANENVSMLISEL